MELFDKKFVHFMWDDELEGEKCFVSDGIDKLKVKVETGCYEGHLVTRGNGNFPFEVRDLDNSVRFVYYDPNYGVKKAFNEGKTIQYQPIDELNWRDVGDEESFEQYLEEERVFRIKPEDEKWIAYLARSSMGTCYLTACREDRWEPVQKDYGAKTKLFIGSESEVEEWYKARQKFAGVIKAWEDGKQIQLRRTCFSDWINVSDPLWDVHLEYRVKPEEETKDKVNPIREKKMRRYNLNLGDWDELKEMAVKMFKGIAALNERFAEKISEGEFVTQDDWKMMNDLWQTFNYTNDDKKLCKDDLHHLFTEGDPDEEFVEIKAEEAKDKKKLRPYINSAEMIADFIDRFKVECPPYCEPFVWVKGKETGTKFLIFAFYETFIKFNDDEPVMFEELFDCYTYLDGSSCGMEVKG